MGSWISLSRIKRKDFITLSDRDAVIVGEVLDNIIDEYEGILEFPSFPLHSELARFIGRFDGESREDYYDRAVEEIAELKEQVIRASKFTEITPEESEYLYVYHNFEELFFLKREYDLEKVILDVFEKDFESEYADVSMPIALDGSMFTCFCELTGYGGDFDDSYIYKLSVG